MALIYYGIRRHCSHLQYLNHWQWTDRQRKIRFITHKKDDIFQILSKSHARSDYFEAVHEVWRTRWCWTLDWTRFRVVSHMMWCLVFMLITNYKLNNGEKSVYFHFMLYRKRAGRIFHFGFVYDMAEHKWRGSVSAINCVSLKWLASTSIRNAPKTKPGAVEPLAASRR